MVATSHGVFSLPDPVNETSVRLAAGVVVEAAGFRVFRQWWLLLALVAGFVARTVGGPTLSPLGQFVHPGRHTAPRGAASSSSPGHPNGSHR